MSFGIGIFNNSPNGFTGSFMLAYPNTGSIKFDGNFDQFVPGFEASFAKLTFQERKDLAGAKAVLEGSFVGPDKLSLKVDGGMTIDGELEVPIADEYKVTGTVNWPSK